jgi:hypothetical protein
VPQSGHLQFGGIAAKGVPAAIDWFSANQDVVWAEIRKLSEEFRKSGK